LTSAVHRRKAIELIGEAHAAGAGLLSACGEIGICVRTLKRWRRPWQAMGTVTIAARAVHALSRTS
jgi:hypothetical protein